MFIAFRQPRLYDFGTNRMCAKAPFTDHPEAEDESINYLYRILVSFNRVAHPLGVIGR